MGCVLWSISFAAAQAFWLHLRLNEINKYEFQRKMTIHKEFLSLGYRKVNCEKARSIQLDDLGLA